MYFFLSRDGHRGFCEVTGKPTDCGLDLGEEVSKFTDCRVAVPTLTDLSSYFSEIQWSS